MKKLLSKIPKINWAILRFYFTGKIDYGVNATEITKLYKRCEYLPIFSGTIILLVAFGILSIFVLKPVYFIYALSFLMLGFLFAWKACIIYIYEEYFKEKEKPNKDIENG